MPASIMGKSNYLHTRLKSFRHAFNGLSQIIKTQQNFRIQSALGLLALIFGFLLHISTIEWCIVVLMIGLVLGAEAINTSLEVLSDTMEKNYNESIKKVKDIAASAVLIFSLTAIIIGCIIFLPKIRDQLFIH